MAIDDLSIIENEMQNLWTADGATPFIADLELSEILFSSVKRTARQYSIRMLLDRYPALGVWAVLYPLSRHYEAKDRDIYPHLENFLNESIPNNDRRILKSRFIVAARKIGIPIVDSTDPTKVFFPLLGVPEPQHPNLAHAFLRTAASKGPPAIEDTVAARHWQRIAVANYCPGQPRLQAPIIFDESAHYARRFDAWRRGEDGVGSGEASLFKAYDRDASRMGRIRSDFVGPPSVIWHRDGLCVVPETSSKTQFIKQGLFPRQISGGKRISVDVPWPETIRWKSGAACIDVAFAPKDNEVLLFDADSGALIQRINDSTCVVEIAAIRLIALSRRPFASPSFGDAISTVDSTVVAAWFDNDETLTFSGREPLRITSPIDTAIWFNGTVLGRNGANALYANDLTIFMRLNPTVGGIQRIVRARFGNVLRYASVELDTNNEAHVPFASFGFDEMIDPGKGVFEVLVLGAAGKSDARVELKANSWIWPGVTPPQGDLSNVPVPTNYDPACSAGLHVDSFDRLSVNQHADAEIPILGLSFEDQTYEFDLAARSEKLWHFRIASNDQIFVPKGSTITFGHDNRHDMLRLRCHDRDADLIVLGNPINRPFIQRQIFEIGAENLEEDTGDDRIALRRADGRLDLLARLRRVDDTSSLSINETDKVLTLTLRPRDDFQAIRVTQQNASVEDHEGDYGFDVFPPALPPLQGIQAVRDQTSGLVVVSVDKSIVPGPGRLIFQTISSNGTLQIIRDATRAPVAVGITGNIAAPSRAELVKLATFLADPEPEALGGQVSRALYVSYADAFNKVGSNKSVGSIKPALNVTRLDEGTARHDIVGVAPWVFEAEPHALSGLSEGTGFSSLRLLTTLVAPDPIPDIDCPHPLQTWLDRIDQDDRISSGLDASGLNDAFIDLRFRLGEMDMKELIGDGKIGNTCRIICGAHNENLTKFRAFDTNGGGNPVPALIAIQIERFSRACAQGRAEEFLQDLITRTGLSREDIGYAMTMMLRAGVRFFVYFRALWGHAIS